MLKFGKKAAVHTPRRMRAMLALGAQLDALGAPPAATNNRAIVRAKLGTDWYQMYGNDRYGDCVWVDSGNAVPLLLANAGAPIVVPTLEQVLGDYSAVTGFQAGPPTINDDGTDENTAIAYLRSNGIAGHKLDDSAPIDPTNTDHIKWAIALFMRLRSGIVVSNEYIQAFEDRQPWTVSLAPGNEGHDVAWLDYDPNGVYAGTWARDDQLIPWDKVAQSGFVDELHAELWYDLIRAAGTAPDGLSLDQLDADLRYIGPEEATYTQNVTTIADHDAIEAARYGIARSPHWATVEREHKAAYPACAAGGGGPIQVHHKGASFHVAKLLGRGDLELTEGNLISLTEGPDEDNDGLYHLYLGHGDDFQKDCNPHVDEDVMRFQGVPCSQIKLDPVWQSHAAACPPAWIHWTREMKVLRRQQLDAEFPIDGPGCQAVVARFPDAAPTPYAEWLASSGILREVMAGQISIDDAGVVSAVDPNAPTT